MRRTCNVYVSPPTITRILKEHRIPRSHRSGTVGPGSPSRAAHPGAVGQVDVKHVKLSSGRHVSVDSHRRGDAIPGFSVQMPTARSNAAIAPMRTSSIGASRLPEPPSYVRSCEIGSANTTIGGLTSLSAARLRRSAMRTPDQSQSACPVFGLIIKGGTGQRGPLFGTRTYCPVARLTGAQAIVPPATCLMRFHRSRRGWRRRTHPRLRRKARRGETNRAARR